MQAFMSGDIDASAAKADALSFLALLPAILLVLVVVLLSAYLRLSLHTATIVATIRGTVQLIVLAYILTPAFALNRWWLTLIYFTILLLISSAEVVSRPSAAYEGMLANVLLSMGVSLGLAMLFAVFLVFRPSPWYDVRIMLPSIALLLSNAVNGISLGLTTALRELTEDKDRVEGLLAIGATRMEAMKGVVQRSLQDALTPAVNQMSVIGIVSLPELLSGQLIAGATPLQAARFQIVIMLLSLVCAALASTAAVFAALLSVMDSSHRLRSDKLLIRHGRESGVAHWLQSQSVKAWNAARKKLHKLGARWRVSLGSRSQRASRGQEGNWLLQSPLARRVLGRKPTEEYEEVGSLDSRLRGLASPGSDDEHESIFSGTFSDTDDQNPHQSAAGGHASPAPAENRAGSRSLP